MRKITASAAIVTTLVVLLLLGITGCASTQKQGIISSSDVGWTIVRSPVTGRCYEVITTYPGNRAGMMAMSEVTQAEYEAYVLRKGTR